MGIYPMIFGELLGKDGAEMPAAQVKGYQQVLVLTGTAGRSRFQSLTQLSQHYPESCEIWCFL